MIHFLSFSSLDISVDFHHPENIQRFTLFLLQNPFRAFKDAVLDHFIQRIGSQVKTTGTY